MNDTVLDFDGDHLMSIKSEFQSLLKLENGEKEKKILMELVLLDQV